MAGRLTLGLYNSYDPRRFAEAHRRALARAAPLALAFDANVATFGFPFEDLAAHGGRSAENRGKGAAAKRGQDAAEPVALSTPLDVATFIARTTSVSSEAEPLVELARAGRFATFELPRKGFPPQLGAVVLTTEHAAASKAATAEALARDLREGRSLLLVFGLGPHGTPEDVRAWAPREFDVTGRHVGLETATAMGACVAAIAALAKR